jgi:hypothetical protein
MGLSHAETTYEYQQAEVDRLKREIIAAKEVIEHNEERLSHLEGQLAASVKKLVAEHPSTDAPDRKKKSEDQLSTSSKAVKERMEEGTKHGVEPQTEHEARKNKAGIKVSDGAAIPADTSDGKRGKSEGAKTATKTTRTTVTSADRAKRAKK